MSLSTALPLTFWKPFLVMTSKANSVSGCGRGKHEVVGRSPVDGRIGEHGDAVVASSNSELEIADDDRVLDGHVDRRQVLHVDAVGVGNKDRTYAHPDEEVGSHRVRSSSRLCAKSRL